MRENRKKGGTEKEREGESNRGHGGLTPQRLPAAEQEGGEGV